MNNGKEHWCHEEGKNLLEQCFVDHALITAEFAQNHIVMFVVGIITELFDSKNGCSCKKEYNSDIHGKKRHNSIAADHCFCIDTLCYCDVGGVFICLGQFCKQFECFGFFSVSCIFYIAVFILCERDKRIEDIINFFSCLAAVIVIGGSHDAFIIIVNREIDVVGHDPKT